MFSFNKRFQYFVYQLNYSFSKNLDNVDLYGCNKLIFKNILKELIKINLISGFYIKKEKNFCRIWLKKDYKTNLSLIKKIEFLCNQNTKKNITLTAKVPFSSEYIIYMNSFGIFSIFPYIDFKNSKKKGIPLLKIFL